MLGAVQSLACRGLLSCGPPLTNDVSLQGIQGRWMIDLVLNALLLSWFTQQNTCAGYMTSWTGIFPLQLGMTASCVRVLLPATTPLAYTALARKL